MSFRIKRGKPIRRELKRLLRRQLKRAHHHLEQDAGKNVHAARKSVKKARAIVRLLREAKAAGLRKDGRRLRAAGRILSKLRDADVVLGTLGRLNGVVRAPAHTLATIRRELTHARARTISDAATDRGIAQAAHALRAVRRSATDWKVPAIEPLDCPELVKGAYRAGRKAMRRAQRTSRASDLHEWRKRIKLLWYELRLLEQWAPSLDALIEDLDKLQTALGEHHDLFVLRSMIANAGNGRGADARITLRDVAKARQDTVRARAFALGRRLLGGKPKAFARIVREALAVASLSRAESSADQSAASRAA